MLNSTAPLRQAVKESGLTLGALAQISRIPRTTLFSRLANPDSLSIGNLRDILDALGANADTALDITAALLWGGESNA